MRSLLLSITLALAVAAPASAAVPHVVAPGETLWQIAAANGFTTRSFAAANGLSPDARVVAGQTLQVPSVAEASAALTRALGAAPGSVPVGDGDGDADDSASSSSSSSAAPAPLGGYIVKPGDTLSALAARSGVSVAQMAFMNGLDPSGVLLAGTVIKLPTGAAAPARASQPAPAATVVPQAAPEPTATRVGASDIQSVASANGVSPSLAAAVAWQESGFNNAMVSSANARGVMQVMPGTWDYVQRNLAGRPLNPASAADNVTAGVLYLRSLLKATGGNEGAAIAAYYQGLGALQSRGVFPETQRYVANVQALRSRFGG
jgi:soluble lytic murein transglycosylase-like protein